MNNRGDVAPRAFVSILSKGDAEALHQRQWTSGTGGGDHGPGQSADRASDGESHLAASLRPGIVETPSNFGQMGARPSNPELLDYLAARFVENKWSIKAMHREIMLSATYASSSESLGRQRRGGCGQSLLWRANWQPPGCRNAARFAAVCRGQSGSDRGRTTGAVHDKQQSPGRVRLRQPRHVRMRRWRCSISRLPINTVEQRIVTNVPLQRLFLMNSSLSKSKPQRSPSGLRETDTQKVTTGVSDSVRTAARMPRNCDSRSDVFFGKNGWNEYARVLLNSNEFLWVN